MTSQFLISDIFYEFYNIHDISSCVISFYGFGEFYFKTNVYEHMIKAQWTEVKKLLDSMRYHKNTHVEQIHKFMDVP